MTFTFLFFALQSFASPDHSSVELSQFQKGNYWTWTYSELNTQTGKWDAYLSERYTVTATDGAKLTIEMSSSPYPYSTTEAHHKMIVDFAKCEKAAANPALKNFTVAFYTKSMSKNWELVSSAHKNLVFTEKFNCAGPLKSETSYQTDILLGDILYKVFQVQSKGPTEASWYFLDRPQLKGVAAYKLFLPNSDYKSELADFCSAGEACGFLLEAEE